MLKDNNFFVLFIRRDRSAFTPTLSILLLDSIGLNEGC